MSDFEASVLDLALLTPESVVQFLSREDSGDWAKAAARVGHCTHPIRLAGKSVRIDLGTGEVINQHGSDSLPLGVQYIRCGNRRSDVCPSCSRIYAADTFQMIRAGVSGGKGVPETVTQNPTLFVTLTAPSFGAVHSTRTPCRQRSHRTCAHGVSKTCGHTHKDDDALVGQPICSDCYDYAGHVIWQWFAPELWRRFTINLRRTAAKALGVSPSKLNDFCAIQFAKVAEFQRRGAVHFHALIRLDGPKALGLGAKAPSHIPGNELANWVKSAVEATRYVVTDPISDRDRCLRFGNQTDIQQVGCWSASESLTAEQVAGYIAKYATKSAAEGPESNEHLQTLRETLELLGDLAADDLESPYRGCLKWIGMLGFRGHFSTKSRRYSVTLGRLREARRKWQELRAMARSQGIPVETAEPLDDEHEETTLVISEWHFLGAGWRTGVERELARAAAIRTHDLVRARKAPTGNQEMRKLA